MLTNNILYLNINGVENKAVKEEPLEQKKTP